jgi:Cysteine-rich secretory protein family
MKLARVSVAIVLTAAACAAVAPPPKPEPLSIRWPELRKPLTETYPDREEPRDPVKAGVFARINADRAAAKLPPVAWDEGASRVADAFCSAQIAEGTNGHFLINGIPPYARTAMAGVFGMGAENAVSWRTTGPKFRESALELALAGQADMMREKPPYDGHRKAILDPNVTHVGVGYAMDRGNFRMAQEFQTRRLAELTLQRAGDGPDTVLIKGRTLPSNRLRFVTIAREPSPRPLTKAEASARTSYEYPEPRLAYVAEGLRSMRVVGTQTEDRIRTGAGGDFSFRLTPTAPGLWILVFYFSEAKEKPTQGGLAVLWVEKAAR